MNVAGLIFSNIHDQSIPELTRIRTMASIPFGCRYRLIDFPLSNMVNSDITTVGIITHNNYQSLMDHIGTGKDWDLARRSGGIKLLPPYVAAYENSVAGRLYSSRLEALIGAENFVHRCQADYMVLSDCDVILNIDLRDVIEEHIRTGAFLTVVTKQLESLQHGFDSPVDVVQVGADGEITEITRRRGQKDPCEVSTNVMVVRRSDLLAVISESLSHGYTSFAGDVIARNLGRRPIRAYRYTGWYAHIDSLASYFACSMQLLSREAREGLFQIADRQIYTKIRNSSPTKYAGDAVVKNSLVADGCIIEGRVENSVLFRGVRVGRGTVVRNSILLQDTFVGSDVRLGCVVTDKNVVIKDGRTLSGHESMPFFIGKGMMV